MSDEASVTLRNEKDEAPKKVKKGKKTKGEAKPKVIQKEITPVTDLRETPGEFFVAIEMPGTRRKDVTVKMNINEMTIKGRKRRVKGLKKEKDSIQELEDGIYVRKIDLPETVQPKKAKTSMKNGILTIEMPKKNYEKPVKVPVK